MDVRELLKSVEYSDVVRYIVQREGLYGFIREFWSVIEPVTPFVDGWHIGAVCEHLEAVRRGQIRELIINIPPGHMKSYIVGVFYHPYVWMTQPEHKFIVGSFDDTLVLRDARKSRDIIQSPLYQQCAPHVQLHGSDALSYYTNSVQGMRMSVSVRGKATGWHGHTLIFDDPSKPKDAAAVSKIALNEVREWWFGTMSTRVADPKNIARIGVMQRLAEGDLAQACLDAGYEHLCLPFRYDPKCTWDRGSSLHFKDPRTVEGQLLWEGRFDEEAAKRFEDTFELESDKQAQLQQNPVPRKGGIIEADWIQGYVELPAGIKTWVQSWDFAAVGTKAEHSRCVGHLWCKVGKDFFLVDWLAGHFGYPEQKRMFQGAQKRSLWKNARVKLVENKATGPTLHSELRTLVAGIRLVTPTDSKETRLRVHSAKFEAGRIFMPDRTAKPEVVEVLEELVGFPRKKWDDHVDCCTQALDYLDAGSRYQQNLRKMKR